MKGEDADGTKDVGVKGMSRIPQTVDGKFSIFGRRENQALSTVWRNSDVLRAAGPPI
jgi:hypothetical protein